ncbi:GFA family protein [Ascidiaceihabitans sp.]|uniref:GFA family protein n=1 Tax=Ascidiaceihabitans sp. TaxID=1872644 RepID=UPI003298AB30
MACPKPPLTGACLCGAVQVTVTAPPLLTLACHCGGCKKLTASAFSLTTMVPKDGFACTGDVIKGGLQQGGRHHYFCKSCLNFVFSEIEGAEFCVNLRTSVLDDAASFPPFVEVMVDQKLSWVDVQAQHSFDALPESLEVLQILMDAYSKQ